MHFVYVTSDLVITVQAMTRGSQTESNTDMTGGIQTESNVDRKGGIHTCGLYQKRNFVCEAMISTKKSINFNFSCTFQMRTLISVLEMM